MQGGILFLTRHNEDEVMANKRNLNAGQGQECIYQIRIGGHLGSQWSDWFGSMIVTLEENGNTCLTGPVVDQSALHALLKKVRNLGMPLISVNRVTPDASDAAFTDIKS
jgi:hypothetical protein